MGDDAWDSLRWFRKQEFRCACCGRELMDYAFMRKLDHLRYLMGIPLVVTSGYRCPDYNDSISNTGRAGPHTTGKAVDIAIHKLEAYALVSKAITLAFTGIGVQQTGEVRSRFIHLDDLGNGPHRPRIWSY